MDKSYYNSYNKTSSKIVANVILSYESFENFLYSRINVRPLEHLFRNHGPYFVRIFGYIHLLRNSFSSVFLVSKEYKKP